MKTILNALFLPLISVLIGTSSLKAAEISPEKENEIRKLLEVTGVMKAAVGMKGQMIAQFRTIFTDAPRSFWDEFEKELNVDEFITLMMPIYDKHFSTEDLKAANAFYQTPAGKRLAEKTPVVSAEGFEAGRKWGEAKGRLAAERLKTRGLTK